jgi:putative Holliday junction resolvase
MINGRFLGVDFGTKRVGLSISDENGQIAFPKEVVPNDKNLFSKLKEVIQAENILEIVVGESTNFDGTANPVAKYIEEFILRLQDEIKLPIHKQKEFLTSVEARRYKDETKSTSNSVDAAAAALILQRYLDLRSRQEER